MTKETKTRASRNENKNTKKIKNKKKRSAGSIVLKVILGLFFIGCIGLLSGAGLFWWYAKDAPSLDEKQLDSARSSKFFALDGEMFEDIGSETRQKITPNQIPKQLEDAIVSVEDRRFYDHIGVDPIRIIGSALSNFKSGGMQGGSTLTQQLIKLSFFSTSAEDQTLKRKAQEAWMAVKLEKEKSKQEILTYYINKVYMSNGLYGMETAAEKFYGKTLDELDLAQTALIAGLPNAPSAFDPYVYKDKAKERRDVVLRAMYDNDKITKEEYEAAKAVPIDEGLQNIEGEDTDWKYYDNYMTEVIKQVKEETGKDVYTDGLNVYTNLDINAQKRLYNIVNTDEYVDFPDDKMQVAATLMDVNTGQVTAQIGARNVPDGVRFGNNLAVNTARDFGSTVKPITDYGPAFEFLDVSTGKTIVDEPYNYVGTKNAVLNWDRQYMGSISLRTALAQSRNVPAAKLFDEVGADKISEFLNGIGVEYENLVQSNAISSNTTTLGDEKYGVSSLKMAAAYAAFANGGTYYKPQYVNKVVYQDGTEDTESFQFQGHTAMKDTTAYMVTDILKDVISVGTGTNAKIDGLFQAGKTGTSNYQDDELAQIDTTYGAYPDISFVGYTPTYSLAVWTGYDDKKTPVTDLSSHVATDVYRQMMQFVSAYVENHDWVMPDGLTRIGNELYLKGTYQAPTSSKNYVPESSSSVTEPSSSETIPSSSETPPSSSSISSESQGQVTPEETKQPETQEPEPSTSSENTGNTTNSSAAPPAAPPESSSVAA